MRYIQHFRLGVLYFEISKENVLYQEVWKEILTVSYGQVYYDFLTQFCRTHEY